MKISASYPTTSDRLTTVLSYGALLLLGSATPRAESARGTPRVRLPERIVVTVP